MTLIGNKTYDENTLNRITIVRLTQLGYSHAEIRKILRVKKSLVSKWMNYEKRIPKKMGRPKKFSEEQKNFIYGESEGKLTILNKSSSRNISRKFKEKFNQSISKSSVNNILFEKFGRPYRGINSILLTEEHIIQRLNFANEILEKKIYSKEIVFTDECRVVLYPRINPKINIIRLNENDKKNIHSYEVNKKRTFFRPKFEVSVMVAGGITKYGLTNLVFCSGTMNNFSYKQFLLFLKQDMENIQKKFNLQKPLLFQQDNASCHRNKESMEAIEILFGDSKIWWPANSPDLSPIETVWSILKQELSKKNNSCLDDLRNNILDIWSKFPNELCEKIIGEFDEKIKLCQKNDGKILSKTIIKENKDKIEYDWDTVKKEKCFRIVYNDKIIKSIKEKFIKNIKHISKTI